MTSDFERQIIEGRTLALAGRGVAAKSERLPPCLVCEAAGRYFAFPPDIASAVRPFSCQPVPLIKAGAQGLLLGVALHGREIASVLDLARLLDPDAAQIAADPAGGGSMLILRGHSPTVALKVDRVLGVMRLQAARQKDQALLPSEDGLSNGMPTLVTLVERATISDAIAAIGLV